MHNFTYKLKYFLPEPFDNMLMIKPEFPEKSEPTLYIYIYIYIIYVYILYIIYIYYIYILYVYILCIIYILYYIYIYTYIHSDSFIYEENNLE